jgi:hypothetical protein
MCLNLRYRTLTRQIDVKEIKVFNPCLFNKTTGTTLVTKRSITYDIYEL